MTTTKKLQEIFDCFFFCHNAQNSAKLEYGFNMLPSMSDAVKCSVAGLQWNVVSLRSSFIACEVTTRTDRRSTIQNKHKSLSFSTSQLHMVIKVFVNSLKQREISAAIVWRKNIIIDSLLTLPVK